MIRRLAGLLFYAVAAVPVAFVLYAAFYALVMGFNPIPVLGGGLFLAMLISALFVGVGVVLRTKDVQP